MLPPLIFTRYILQEGPSSAAACKNDVSEGLSTNCGKKQRRPLVMMKCEPLWQAMDIFQCCCSTPRPTTDVVLPSYKN